MNIRIAVLMTMVLGAVCYIAAFPFSAATVIGGLFFTALLFGAFAVAEKRFGVLAPARTYGAVA